MEENPFAQLEFCTKFENFCGKIVFYPKRTGFRPGTLRKVGLKIYFNKLAHPNTAARLMSHFPRLLSQFLEKLKIFLIKFQ